MNRMVFQIICQESDQNYYYSKFSIFNERFANIFCIIEI